MTVPRRVAHVWTPEGILCVPVVGDWPERLAHGPWIYAPNLAVNGAPLVRRGCWFGVDSVDYQSSRRIGCEDVPTPIEPYGLTQVRVYGK
jgi:hypothetical protein